MWGGGGGVCGEQTPVRLTVAPDNTLFYTKTFCQKGINIFLISA